MAVFSNITTGKDIRNSNSQCYTKNDKSGIDTVEESNRHLSYNPMHVNKAKQGTIHQYTGNHRDNRRNGQYVIGNMKPMYSFNSNQADYKTSHKRTYYRTESQLKIHKVTGTYGNNTSYSHHPKQTTLDIENHGKSHSRNSGSNGIYIIRIMGNHT